MMWPVGKRAISKRSLSFTTSRPQETPAGGVWTDPSTGLMWTGKDSGKDVSWKSAAKYCRDLRLGGYSDWRLASLDELGGIYNQSVNAPGLAGPGSCRAVTWHVKGNLFLTGNQWSGNRRNDDRGKPSGYEWYFDFNDGRSNNQPSGWPYSSAFMRALCVRGSSQALPQKSGPTLAPIP
jgi:hypothetical protein